MTHYRRLFILIQHRNGPLFLDLLGTGYLPADGPVKEQRPFPLRHAHIQAHRNRLVKGWGPCSPDDLDDKFQDFLSQGKPRKDAMLFAKVGADGHDEVFDKTTTEDPMTRSGDTTRKDIAIAAEFFVDESGAGQLVEVSASSFDFGNCGSGESLRRKFTVTNRTHGKVSIAWAASNAAFIVTPDTADVGAGKGYDFDIRFAPTHDGASYFDTLEATAFFKNQRSFRLVNDATLSPPWHLRLRCYGHSFLPSHDRFAPQFSFEPPDPTFQFPACHLGDATYQVLKFQNNSNLPAIFEVIETLDDDDDGDNRSAFTVAPMQGLVPGNSFQLVLVKFAPTALKGYSRELKIKANGHLRRGPRLLGFGHVPRCALKGGVDETDAFHKKLTFPPTCVGLATKRTFQVQNEARVPLIFQVSIPEASIFRVKPKSGLLRGNEAANVTVGFAPRATGVHHAKVQVSIKAIAGAPPRDGTDSRQLGEPEPATTVQTISATIVAPAAGGVIAFEPAVLDFPPLLVNATATKTLILSNTADCAVSYTIYIANRQVPLSSRPHHGDDDSSTQSLASLEAAVPEGRWRKLLVDEPSGVMPARSKKPVRVTFQPDAAGPFEFACVCRVRAAPPNDGLGMDNNVCELDPADAAMLALGADARDAIALTGLDPLRTDLLDDILSEEKDDSLPLTCVVRGKASFPTVRISDVRPFEQQGTMSPRPGVATKDLWAHFSCGEVNETLARPLTREDVAFNLESSPDLTKLPRFPLKFIPSPLGSPAQVVVLEIENPGALSTAFSIHLPNEKDIEIEIWADEGEPNQNDVKLNRIIDELKCFDVKPRAAELGPGEKIALRFVYDFASLEFDGDHTLPVLLKVHQGKQLWLDLQGRTLSPAEPKVIVAANASNALPLADVPIGTLPEEAPLQTIDLVNVGNMAVDYKILDIRRPSGSWLEEVIHIENPEGRAEARIATPLKLRFLPLEAILYDFEVTIEYVGTVDDLDDPMMSMNLLSVTGGLTHRSLATTTKNKPPEEDRTRQLTFRVTARGVVKAEEPDFGPPERQLVAVPRQGALLSQDRVAFGTVPQRAHVTQLLVLRPISIISPTSSAASSSLASSPKEGSTESGTVFDYQWEASHELMTSGVLEMEPSSGTITDPTEPVTFKLTLRADCEPRIIDATVLCLVKERQPPAAGRKGRQVLGTPTSVASKKARTSVTVSRSPETQSTLLGSASRESLATKVTVSQEKHLTHKMLVGERRPTMPTYAHDSHGSLSDDPRPHPLELTGRSGLSLVSDVGSTWSAATTAHHPQVLNATFLRIHVCATIVSEDRYLKYHDITGLRIPKPHVFIPPSDHAKIDPLLVLPKPPPSDMPPKPPPKVDDKSDVVRRVVGDLVREALGAHETRDVLRNLPASPVVPTYHEMKRKVPVATRLQAVLPDLPISTSTLRHVLVHDLHVKGAEAKRFFNGLQEAEMHDLTTWLTTAPSNVQRSIDVALDDRIHNDKLDVMIRRHADRAKMYADQDQAATRLQNVQRRRRSHAIVERRKYLASDQGKLETNSATALQQSIRGHLSRKAAHAAYEKRLLATQLALLGQPTFQAMLSRALDSTIFNLLMEAQHDEFDLFAPPVHQFIDR